MSQLLSVHHEAKGMKTCSVRIINAQQTVSPAFHTQGFSMNNPKADLKHLIAINSLISSIFSSLGRFAINLRCSTCSLVVEPGLSGFSQFPFSNQIGSKLIPATFIQNIACRVYLGHAMEASQSIGKGMHSGITARYKPQRD